MTIKNLLRIIGFITTLLIILFQSCSKLDVDFGEIEYINPVKIGVILPLSVERAGEESAYFATILAAEEINRGGGINGRDIEIILKDDGGSVVKGPEEVRSLKNEGVDIIIGAAWSSVTLAVSQQVTIPNNMLLISHSSTSPRITTLDDNGLVWRLAPSDEFQGKIGADYLYNVLGKKTVGVLYSTSAWATDLAGVFKSEFEKLGGNNSVLSFVSFPEEQEWAVYNFAPHLDELFANKPEAVYFVSYSIDGAKITNDIYIGDYINDEYKPQVFSNDGPYGFDFLVNGHPDVLEGMMGTQPTGLVSDENYSLFINNYKNRFGFAPEPFSEQIYDAVYLIAYAMLKAGSQAPGDVAFELRNVSGGDPEIVGDIITVNEFVRARNIIADGGSINYNGASGLIKFDANGDPGTGAYIIWKVTNREYIVETTVIFP